MVPVLEPAPAMIFSVDAPEPGAAIFAGVKLTLTPDGRPDAVRAIAELKLPETAVVIVEVPEPPQATINELGKAIREKSVLAAAVTVRANVAVTEEAPLLPAVIVIV